MDYQVIDESLHIQVPENVYPDLKELLETFIPSSKLRYSLFEKKEILLNGASPSSQSAVHGELILPLRYEHCPLAQGKKIDILYEDALFLAAYKPKGMLVHSDGETHDTLTDFVERQIGLKVQPSQRLDKDTDGIVLFSKSKLFEPYLDYAIREKRITRVYQAVVKGSIKPGEKTTYNGRIGRDRHDAKKMRISSTGKDALTHVKCLRSRRGVSLLECRIETGRTHQIRVHLSSAGYPILNDPLYGVSDPRFSSMALSSTEVSFYHPLKEERIDIVSPLFYEQALYFEDKR